MTPDDGESAASADAQAWLDGLAGRGGANRSARDGARLREALKPSATESTDEPVVAWPDIVTAAHRTPASPLPNGPMPRRGALRSKRAIAGAMVVVAMVLAVAVWIPGSPDDDAASRTRGAPAALGAVWRTEQPQYSAHDLAGRLEAAGARVTMTPIAEGVRLDIECAPDRCPAVAALLTPLELGVDSGGRLTLRVLPLH